MTPDELKAWRERRGLSRYRLDKLLGLSDGTVGRWERGHQRIEHERLLELALEGLERREGEVNGC